MPHAAVRRADAGADALVRQAEVAARVLERERGGRGRELCAAIHAARVAARRRAPRRRSPRSRQTGVGGSPSSSSTLAPETPSASASQNAPTPVPIELTTPTPVTTTLRPMALESARWPRRSRDGCGGVPRSWVYAEPNDRKLPASHQLSGPSPRRSLLHHPHVDRSPQTARRPPARAGRGGLHADPTRNGLTAPEEIGAARSLVHAYRTHGHMAARLDPLGSDPIGDPALDPAYHGLDRGRARAHPGRRARPVRAGRDAGRRAAAPARDLLRPDRVPDRAPLGPSPAPAGCARRSSRGATRSRCRPTSGEHILDPAAARRDVRALPAPRVPRREAVLDRGPRHDDPDARRDDHAGRRRPASRRPCSAWRTAGA